MRRRPSWRWRHEARIATSSGRRRRRLWRACRRCAACAAHRSRSPSSTGRTSCSSSRSCTRSRPARSRPAEIATPLRVILSGSGTPASCRRRSTGFDLERREVLLDHLPNGGGPATLGYDTLIVAGGSHYSYFGHEEWRTHAPELKSLAGALDIRSRVLAGVRGRRGRARPCAAPELAHLRRRRRRPDRRRDGRADRRARARRAAAGLPLRSTPHGARAARRGRATASWRASPSSSRGGHRARSKGSASRRSPATRWST